MKLTIKNEYDIRSLEGQFVVQEIEDKGELIFNEDNWSFISEKRLSFISEYTFAGFFYVHKACKNKDEFVEYFNNPSKGRYFRLLRENELKFVFSKLKSI